MAVRRFVSTGYKPLGTLYFAPDTDSGATHSSFFVIREDTDDVPYYVQY